MSSIVSSPPFLDPDMTIPITQLLQAERMHMARQVLALHALYPHEPFSVHSTPYRRNSAIPNGNARSGKTIPTNTGVLTIQSPKRFVRKINHSVGFGMAGNDNNNDNDTANPISWPTVLADVEAVYRANSGATPDLDLVESAHPDALTALESAGYRFSYEIATYARRMRDLIPLLEGEGAAPKLGSGMEATEMATKAGEVVVQRFEKGNAETAGEFVRESVNGFRSNGRAEELLRLLAESAAHRDDTVLFRAMMQGQLVGTAGMAILEIDGGQKFANLYIDSTLNAARGKGVHRALLLARMRAARDAGCDVVIASAQPTSGSARNIERVGLKKAFMYRTFKKQEDVS